jgi:hypothetical protein
MKPHIAKLAAQMLEEYSDRLGNDGCNDMWLPDTPENRQFLLDLAKWNGENFEEEDVIQSSKYGLGVFHGNSVVAAYLAYLLKQESK